jgi:tRNA (guanine37-N1)-methyltransferase
LKIDILTIFPNIFKGVFEESIIKRAVEKKLLRINVIDFRAYSRDKHRKVDDKPYGGGAGMVIKPEPVFEALSDVLKEDIALLKKKRFKRSARVILLTPQGRVLNQKLAKRLVKYKQLVFICGRYEGFDERIRKIVTDEISIGDYVLTGGEIPAMAVTDAVTRLIPGVLGDRRSNKQESFEESLLEYPHYTRPPEYLGMKVPGILLSGKHDKISQWRKEQSIKRTRKKRPDLWLKIDKKGC